MSMKFVLAATGLVWATIVLHIMGAATSKPGIKMVSLMVVTVSAEMIIGIAYLARLMFP